MLGVEVVGCNALQSVILEYFSHIFSSSRPDAGVNEEIVACLEPKVTDEMNSKLLCPFTSEEVKQTRDVMHPLKFSRPDDTVNHTHIVFLPKCGHSKLVSDFGYISLCNVIYKLASNRLKLLLENLISHSQSTFVPNRLILDNVLLVYEINHYLAHKYQGRGLRQGDPLSPYLFLSCEEASNGMKRRAEEEGYIRGVRVCRSGPRVSRLLFADDILIFHDVNRETLQFVRNLLAKFESLAHQVLRAKYFPNPDFFTAPIGSNSSLWHSFWRLLMSSVRWDVGDGTKINVMGDPRLPRLSMFKLISSPKSLPPSVSVSLLPNEDHNWNQELIKEEFGSLDAECILQITTRTAPGTSNLIWNFGKKGFLPYAVCMNEKQGRLWRPVHPPVGKIPMLWGIAFSFGKPRCNLRCDCLLGTVARMTYLHIQISFRVEFT
ncbi:UNVERIFIED_CONTAM: hypothetical protein Sradi_1338600 [Sesamum radiatum]|uniref:Reverse transcriptase domain-containing protein n=1 Tax=Sesamum radiatum TaxID=300843 RepID=A0AAW2UT98_SESRA